MVATNIPEITSITELLDFLYYPSHRDPIVVVNYIIWTVINHFIKVMPQRYRDAYDDFAVTVTGNKTSYRWKECIDAMQSVFGMPLGLLFVDAAFDERSKETVREKLNTSEM